MVKDVVRSGRRYNKPLEEGVLYIIDEAVLYDEEKLIYKDFLDKPAKNVGTIPWSHSIIGQSYINRLEFDDETFDIPIVKIGEYEEKGCEGFTYEEHLDFIKQLERFNGCVNGEILKRYEK